MERNKVEVTRQNYLVISSSAKATHRRVTKKIDNTTMHNDQ